MFEGHLVKIREEFRKNLALEFVSRIAGHHRVQASPGIMDAARYVSSTLTDFGLESEILSYPARKDVKWWAYESFREWACAEAELALVDGDTKTTLCSYHDDKMSVVHSSNSTPEGGVRTSLVYLEGADKADAYKDKDVKGKIVFSRGSVTAIAKKAVREHGALGIVVDNLAEIPHVRARCDLPDARQYTSFSGDDIESLGFGFELTPRQGDMLREKCGYGSKELPAFVKVTACHYDGQIPVVNAIVRGETREEVVAVAHLCHPQPSANDNASGCGTLMETARTLKRLISDGVLPRPKRSIRFLFLPEMTGSYAYLSQNEDSIARVIAAINLDMVGENQELCKSGFIVEKPPRATSSMGGHMAEAILRYLAKQVKNFFGTASLATFRWAVTPYMGGSDHYIWADPTVGITCPSLAQWPDKFYHTNHDTIDKVDPKMLALAGVLAGTYLYWFATAGPREAAWLAREMASHLPFELYDAERETLNAHLEKCRDLGDAEADAEIARVRRALETKIQFMGDRSLVDLNELARLADEAFADQIDGLRRYINETVEFSQAKAVTDLVLAHGLKDPSALPPTSVPMSEYEDRCKGTVMERLVRGPFSIGAVRRTVGCKDQLAAFAEKWKGQTGMMTFLLYWSDGERDLSEVADMIEGETGQRNAEFLLDCAELLERAGLVRLKRLHPNRNPVGSDGISTPATILTTDR